MHLRYLTLPLIAMGAMAACQSTGTAPAPAPLEDRDAADAGRPSPSGATAPAAAEAPADAAFSTPAAPRVADAAPWDAGTTRIALGGSFVQEDTEEGPLDPGDDVESLDLNATLGVFVSERVELNAQGTYHELDVGTDDVNQVGLLGGLRYHLILPSDHSPVGAYAEGKAGVLSVDRAAGDSTDFAYGASGGVIWFPWGVPSGVAIDVALNYLKADEIDRTTASLALAYYW